MWQAIGIFYLTASLVISVWIVVKEVFDNSLILVRFPATYKVLLCFLTPFVFYPILVAFWPLYYAYHLYKDFPGLKDSMKG